MADSAAGVASRPGAATLLLVALLASPAGAAEPGGPPESRAALEELAGQVRDAVVRGDVEALLALVAPEGLSCADSHESRSEIRAQLEGRSGRAHELLFDVEPLRARIARWGGKLPPEKVSYQDFFRKHPDGVLFLHGEPSSGLIQWQLRPEGKEPNAPRFGYRWDAGRRRYAIVSIGCT
jgi:hypothetical protein